MKNIFKRKRFWVVAVLVSAFFVARYFNIASYLTLEALQDHRDSIQLFIDNHYWWSVFIFWCLYVFENVLALPIAAWLTLAAGYFYGIIPAIIYTVFSATCGALVLFLMARYLIGNHLQKKYSQQLAAFNKSFQQQGVYYLLSVRLMPMIPFVAANVCAGLTLVSARTFVWTTLIGMIPITSIYVIAGQQFQTITSVYDIFSWKVALMLGILFLLALAPVIIKQVRGYFK